MVPPPAARARRTSASRGPPWRTNALCRRWTAHVRPPVVTWHPNTNLETSDQLRGRALRPQLVLAFFAAGSAASSSPSSSSSNSSSSSSSRSSSSSPSNKSSSSWRTCFHSAAVNSLGRSSAGSLSLLASKYSLALMKASAVPFGPSDSTICSTSSKSWPTPRMSTGTIVSSSGKFSGNVNSLTSSEVISSDCFSFSCNLSRDFLHT
mmetsp:Transcript_1506/g.4428  ORF Transcript_1506/g.4428 Transcript_1506/m.4428 type:complete len:207 (+) Transcript_1506:82-702(+)